MSRFPLKSETIVVRGETITVSELSTKQKREWAKAVQADGFMAVPSLCALVCNPPVTVEQADEWPSEISEQVVDIARRLSGLKQDDEEEQKKD